MGELIDFPRPLSPDEGQTDYFHAQAAYWGEVEEVSYQHYEYAKEQRSYYLRMLGMLALVPGAQE